MVITSIFKNILSKSPETMLPISKMTHSKVIMRTPGIANLNHLPQSSHSSFVQPKMMLQKTLCHTKL